MTTDIDLDEVVREYVHQTLVCSFWHMMRRAPVYAVIEAFGDAAVAPLLRNLASDDPGGMCVMHALTAITSEWPEAESVADEVAPGWVGVRVDDARQAWIRWGRKKGYL